MISPKPLRRLLAASALLAVLGDIAVGTDVSHVFTVTLACDPSGYHDRTISFTYTLTGSNVYDQPEAPAIDRRGAASLTFLKAAE